MFGGRSKKYIGLHISPKCTKKVFFCFVLKKMHTHTHKYNAIFFLPVRISIPLFLMHRHAFTFTVNQHLCICVQLNRTSRIFVLKMFFFHLFFFSERTMCRSNGYGCLVKKKIQKKSVSYIN